MNTKFLTWHITPNLILGQKALANCLNDTGVKNPTLHVFLSKECNHLLDLQESSASHIPKNLLTPPVPGMVNLRVNFSIAKIKPYVGMAGCYAYFNKEGELLYIGSNTDYVSRMKNHYSKSKDLNRAFYNYIKTVGGFQHCQWVPILPFKNLAIKYQGEGNVLSEYDLDAMKFVTQFQARIVEQTLIHHFQPKFNSDNPVLFNNFWYYATVNDKDNVKVINVNGDVKYFSSLLKASLYTGVSDNHIRNVCNCTVPIYVYSSVMEEYLHFVVNFRPMVEPKVKVRYGNLKGFDTSILPERMVSVLTSQKKWLGMEYTYTHPQQAKNKLDIVYDKDLVYKVVNSEERVFSSVLNDYVYLVTKNKSLGYKHLETQAKTIKVTDTRTNEVQIFQRQTDVHKALGMSNKTVMKYLANGRLYNSYLFEYGD